MTNDVSYNQLISLRGSTIKCYALLGSHVSEGKLILIIGNNKKIAIDGKDIEVTGQTKRIQKIVALAVEKGFDIPEKSIKHYAKEKGIEYVLVRLK
ncbi:hypothetical protein ACFL1R_13050 [Candidatus Latescibacterota bacterium]